MALERIQLRRVKGWRMPPNTRSVARPGRYGNPWKVGDMQPCVLPGEPLAPAIVEAPITPLIAKDLYRRSLFAGFLPYTVGELIDELDGLEAVGCWCPVGEPCHGDVIVDVVNSAVSTDGALVQCTIYTTNGSSTFVSGQEISE